MKKIIKYKIYILLIQAVLVTSCVTDDSFFPDQQSGDIVSSPALVSVLANFDNDNLLLPEGDQCFKFIYPIVLGYNTNSSIKIESYEGLLAVVSSQEGNFNVTGLQFPIQVMINQTGVIQTITDENAFVNLVKQCEYDTLRNEFDEYFDDCFKLAYPITFQSTDGREISVSSEERLISFLETQGDDYQPFFVFPITLLVGSNLEPQSINTYFEFYEILNNCGRLCPDLSFEFEQQLGTFIYDFTTSFSGVNDLERLDWYIARNGDILEQSVVNENGSFQYEFNEPGTYQICIKTETPSCLDGVTVCQIINVAPICPELSLEQEQEQGTFVYNFTVDVQNGVDLQMLRWEVSTNNDILDEDVIGVDNVFEYQFSTPGIYQMCVKTETPICPNGVVFCKEIVVEPICPDLSFMAEQEQGTNSYTFTADFNQISSIAYNWIVDGDIIESDGGDNGDNTLLYQFDQGVHEICIRAETDTCPNGTEYCEQITIP